MTERHTLWTSEQDQALLDLVRGGKTTKQAADALGKTKNAIVGRFSRLKASQGLSLKWKNTVLREQASREEKIIARRIRRRQRASRQRANRKVANGAPPEALCIHKTFIRCNTLAMPLPETGLVTILEVQRDQCRAPYGGTGLEFRMCGRRVKHGSSFCEAHHAAYFRPSPDRSA